jgi:8-oxo-dGTP diphosphatase
MEPSAPLVGVGVIVLRGELALFGKRAGSHGAGTWALPGGHLEFGESVEACAAREVREEAGLVVQGMAHGPYTNDLFASEGKHYVTLFVTVLSLSGEPQLLEPNKCSVWQWFRWSELPKPLIQPVVSLVRSGYVPKSAP